MGTFKSISRNCRVSVTGDPDPLLAGEENTNQDPLCDEFGRLWARQWPAVPPPPQPSPSSTTWFNLAAKFSLEESAAPVNDDVPVFSWPMPAAPALSSLDIGGFPYLAGDSMWFAFSTTGDKLTLGPVGWLNALVGAP